MKNYIRVVLLAFSLVLASCSGSDIYQGDWKATDTHGTHFEIHFGPKSFSITDTNGKAVNYEYTQNSVKIENSVRTYGIKLKDGRGYSIFFPITDETGKGVILLENTEPAYTISRTSYIQYNDLYKLTE